MSNFFSRDERSRIGYDAFGDVSFDTTYQTNKYSLICAPLVGVNHHWQTIMFRCVLSYLVIQQTYWSGCLKHF